jgi:hypothetical protein
MLTKLVIALVAGFIVFFVLAPTSGAEPPLCYSLLGQTGCDWRVAATAGLLTGAFVGFALWLGSRIR